MTNQEIDEAVARKLGHFVKCGIAEACDLKEIPAYSTKIEAAWEIMEAGEVVSIYKTRGGWMAHTKFDEKEAKAFCDKTAPLAICKAFLELKDGTK